MNHLKRKIVASIIAVSIAIPIGVAFAETPTDLKNTIEAKSKELEAINNQINETQSKLNEVSTQNKSLSKEIKTAEYSIKSLELNIRSSEVTIDKLSLELVTLDEKLSDAEIKIGDKKETIATLMRALNDKEKVSPLALFLSGSSLADSILEMNSLRSLQVSLGDEVKNLQQLSAEIDSTISESENKKSNLEDEALNLKSRKGIVEDQKIAKADLLKQTKNKESAYQSQLSVLEKKQEEINSEMEKLEDSLRQYFNADLLPSAGTKVFIRPVPASARVTQNYGINSFSKTAYKSGSHNGIDFGVPIGTPIRAAADGKVLRAGDNGKYQYGKYVLIEHENNLVTIYGHLSRHAVSTGAQVKQGDIIGYSGNTGYSTGPHLHFGAYSEPASCKISRVGNKCVQLKTIGAAGLVPVGITIDPASYL